MFIQSTVNLVKFLCVILGLDINHTNSLSEVFSVDKESIKFWIYKPLIKQSDKNTEEPFTPSEVRLSFTDLFSCHESKLISKPVTQNSPAINQRC
uniref:Uncharacterized protein n=1 Tax=Magallana gigas TaxID=29159 RepID=K1R0W2_MAGGI